MKGLLCNTLNRKEEAYQLVKEGVKNNLRSHVCWHVYGYVAEWHLRLMCTGITILSYLLCRLVYRSDRNYDEAIKCYKNALRMDKDNLTVLRDLAQLQIQMRDIPGFLESRQRLLELKPTVRQGWVSLALAHHLEGNYDVASVILEQYEATLDDLTIQSEPYEHSEILLYKVSILQEGQKFMEAISALDAAEKAGHIRDTISAMEMRAQIYASLGRFAEAANIYNDLLSVNVENYKYHQSLIDVLDAKGGDMKNPSQMDEYYQNLQEKFPSSPACRRIPLDFLKGTRFEESLRTFMVPYIEKGIPSLFTELKPLYTDSEKVLVIGKVLVELTSQFADKQLSWVYLCLSLHHCECSEFSKAFRAIDECIKLQPNLIEAYSAKSKILDAAGDAEGAAFLADYARKMDLSDRYLNCQASIALFNALESEKAESVSHLFTKVGDQGNNFFDMQAMWYEMASGNCYFDLKQYGLALKRFKKVEEHFADFMEDQFDFHGYCVRKQTMRAYVEALRMLDNIYSNEVYALATEAVVKVYIYLFENPRKTEEEMLEARLAGMTPEQAKKERQKMRKQEAKKKKQEEELALSENSASKDASGRRIDPDPKGEALLKVADPLEEANKMIKRLLSSASDNLTTYLLAYKVDIRRGKVFLALKHLNNAIRIASAQNPLVHECIMDMAQRASSRKLNMPLNSQDQTPIFELVREQMYGIMGVDDHVLYHSSWKEGVLTRNDFESLYISFKIDSLLEESTKDQIWRDFVCVLGESKRFGSHRQCKEALTELEERIKPSLAVIDSYKAVCAEHFTYSRTFSGSKCIDIIALGHEMGSLSIES